MSLRDKLVALATSARINVFAGGAPIQTKEALALAAARLALDEALRECAKIMAAHVAAGHSYSMDYHVGASQCERRLRALRDGMGEP